VLAYSIYRCSHHAVGGHTSDRFYGNDAMILLLIESEFQEGCVSV